MSSYLGRGLEQVDNISKLDNITFNGGTTYALTKDSAAFTPISSNALLVSIDGVIQQGNFSVSGTNIVFNFSPTGSNTCDFIMHYGTGVAFTPADSSITKDKTNFVSTSSSAGLEIKGDGTTDGTLQLNCSQNSHGIKLKSPNHASSSSYTITFPATDPAANKMLQTDGSGNLSFVDAPSGSLEYLQGSTSTSNATLLAQDGFVDDSKYAYYKIFFYSRRTNEAQTISARFRGGGSELTANNYRSHISSHYNNGEHDSSLTNTYATIETDMSTRSAIFEFDMMPHEGINNNSSYLVGRGFNYKYNSDNQYQRITLCGFLYNENVDVNGIQFEVSGGFARHELRIYGVKP